MSTNLIDRDQLSEEQLSEALKHCADEPIHIPNCIQPHGFVVVTAEFDNKIVQISSNCAQYLEIDPQHCIGKDLKDVIGSSNVEALNNIIRNSDLAPYKYTSIQINSRTYDAVVHFSGGFKIIECEPGHANIQQDVLQHIYEDLHNYSIEAQQSVEMEALYKLIVKHVRKITKFGRVKLYKFDEFWNGSVIAESKIEKMPSYLGLHFPASDIPEQARRLYSINYLRLIPDIRYKPSPLYPARISGMETPLDMSYSILRSVSPVHIQYLENICVQASMSISVMQDGKLWGLIACHHDEPLHLPHSIRVLCEIVAHIFSAKLTNMRRAIDNHRYEVRKVLIEKLSMTTRTSSFEKTISKDSDIALQALDADGIAIFSGKDVFSFGYTLANDVLNGLRDWYRQHGGKVVMHTHNASEYFKGDERFANFDGGILFVPIGIYSDDIAIWLRKPRVSSVNWAGNPEKPLEQTKAGYRLTPRSSFELWQTTVSGQSTIWSEFDVETAEAIAQIILENSKIQSDIANKAKSDFLSHMSHELRTPLGAIVSTIQVLGRSHGLNDEQRRLVTNLEVSSDSLLGVINDLLDVGKIEANEIKLELMPFTISEVFEDVRSVMSVKASEKDLQLGISYNSVKDSVFIGDATKIKQILFNLVNNSIKFTERGFVNLIASATLAEKADTKILTFEVIDSGIGIEEAKFDTIFEKFTQADNSTSRIYGGTGLGLSICKNFVELMGGRIEVTSKVGLGSNFRVTIPMPFKEMEIPQDQPLLLISERQHEQEQDKLRVLLAEDYEGNIVWVLDYLQSKGCEVVIARNGQIAVNHIQASRFDIVLMDVQMPQMDGLTATRLIREMIADNKIPPTPILGMTANALKEDRDRCLEAGMDDYISKPMRLDEMTSKMRKLVENNRSSVKHQLL